MVLSMPRPFKHPKTGVYYFRQKTPADLRAIFGKGEAGWSLGTKDPEEAKRLNAGAVQQQAAVWDRLRKRPEPLPHKQIVALSGTLYRDLMATLETEPGEPSIWVEVLKLLDRVASAPDGREKWYGPEADRLMVEHGIVTDAASRTRMLIELDKALRQAAAQQLKRAEGDYSPDPKADRFPTPESSRKIAATSKPEGQTIRGVFKLWERDHLAEGKSPKTVGDFRQKIESLINFVGHDVARDVTSDNVAEWCDHLRHKEEIGARTVSQKYLAAVKVVFALAVEKRKLTENPAKDIKVRFKKPSKVRPKGFTDAEAVSILKAALSDPEHFGARSEVNKRAIRWVPWICAFSGARVTEITQLRKEDLIAEHGVLCFRITPEAGSVKTSSYRLAPVHPQLLEMGIKEMVRGLPDGPLFYSMDDFQGKKADPLTRARSTSGNIGEWVRDFAGVKDPKVQPNHAWRHRFKTIARDTQMDMDVRDAIQGHDDGRAASDYGEVTVKAMWAAMQSIPHFNIRV